MKHSVYSEIIIRTLSEDNTLCSASYQCRFLRAMAISSITNLRFPAMAQFSLAFSVTVRRMGYARLSLLVFSSMQDAIILARL